MLDTTPRVTFRLDDTTYAQVCALAQRHELSLSQLCRDAITLLLRHPEPFYDLLSSRVLAHCKPPTAEQAHASAALIDAAMATDWTARFLSTVPPQEPCVTGAREVQINA
jgi:hypothetical protein